MGKSLIEIARAVLQTEADSVLALKDRIDNNFLIGEQAPHIEITAAGQAGPNHLVPQAGDAHRVGAGEGQHSA